MHEARKAQTKVAKKRHLENGFFIGSRFIKLCSTNLLGETAVSIP